MVKETIKVGIVLDLQAIKNIQQSLAEGISSPTNGYSYADVVAYLLKLGLQEYLKGVRLAN